MQIKRFEAKNINEAFKNIKQEFGPNAVILSARSLNVKKNIFNGTNAPRVEVTAATDNYVEDTVKINSQHYAVDHYAKMDELPKRKELDKKAGFFDSVNERLQPFKNMSLMKSKSLKDNGSETIQLKSLMNHLKSHGVEEEIVQEIIDRISDKHLRKRKSSPKEIRSELIGVLKQIGIEAGIEEKKSNKKNIICLVGLTGVGKTSTLVKLAASQILTSDKTVGVISLDTNRIASNLMLNVYAKIIGFQLECINQPKAIKAALKKLKEKDVIFVDTPGISLNDDELRYKIKDNIDKISPQETHLVLNSNTKRSDAAEIIRKFNIFDFNHLLFTKIDETLGFGTIINHLFEAQRPLSYITYGQNIPEDISQMNMEILVNLLMDSNANGLNLISKNITDQQKIMNRGLYGIGYN